MNNGLSGTTSFGNDVIMSTQKIDKIFRYPTTIEDRTTKRQRKIV